MSVLQVASDKMSVLQGAFDKRRWGEESERLGFWQLRCEVEAWALELLHGLPVVKPGPPRVTAQGLLGASEFLFQGRRVEDAVAEPRSLLLSLPAPFSSRTKCLHCFKITLLPRCFPSQASSKFLLCAPKHNAFSGCWSFRMEMKISE